jgi:hypothetical protein
MTITLGKVANLGTWEPPLPSAVSIALGKDFFLKNNSTSLLSVSMEAHVKETFFKKNNEIFIECLHGDTRQSISF